MHAKTLDEIPTTSSSGYPEPFRSRVLPRDVRRLADAFGLTRLGVNIVTVHPAKESSVRHTHTREDELVFMLEGELVLHTTDGEEPFRPGMFVAFRAGDGDAHHFLNRSGAPATFLVASNRDPEDTAVYPDDDLACAKGPDGRYVFSRKSDRG